MPNWKRQKKSRSVNDIPIEKKHDHILQSLDDGDFQDLLNSVSQPLYNRSSSGFVRFNDLKEEPKTDINALVKVCEKGLRDEDAAREELRKRRENGLSSQDKLNNCSRSPSPPERPIISSGRTQEKPVDFDTMNIEYIDDMDRDVEMTDLSGVAPAKKFTRGNREVTAHEFSDDELESGTRRAFVNYNHIHHQPYHWPTDPQERALDRDGLIYKHHHTVLPPQNDGLFSGTSYAIRGTDEIPNLTPSNMPLPATAQRVHIDPESGNQRPSEEKKIAEPPAITNSKIDKNRKKNRKKEKELKNTYRVPETPDCMGALALDVILPFIEGPSICVNNKKQKGQGDNDETVRKERRRKSKESKEDALVAPKVATIGQQQTKAPSAPTEQPQAVSVNNNKENAGKKASPKRRKSQNNVNNVPNGQVKQEEPQPRAARCSTEDAEEEFLSADEGVVSSASDDINQVAASDLMMDGANFRADDEDVTMIDKQVEEEQAFITVSNKAKKRSNPQQTTRTGSAGKTDRRQRPVHERGEQPRRSSLEERPAAAKGRRPNHSLADFLDDKPEVKSSPPNKVTPSKRKNQRVERLESTADSEFHDARSDDIMATTVVNGTPSPERTFSYADAAKKSSEQSRENSPTEQNKQTSTTAQANPRTPSPGQVVIASSSAEAPSSAGEISFFYDENEASASAPAVSHDNKENKQAETAAFVLNLGDKTIRFAKGMAVSAPIDDERRSNLLKTMAEQWSIFHRDSAPVVYKPRTPVQ